MRPVLMVSLALAGAIAVVGCGGSSTAPAPAGGSPAQLKTLVDLTTGLGLDVTAGGTGTWNFAGQSFVVPQTGSFNNLRFHWYTFQKTPVAFGTLTLLSQEYAGLPKDLSSSTPGFVARSERLEGDTYVFAETAMITGGTKYWVYTDTQGSFAGSFDQDIYTGGDMYVTGVQTLPFRKAQASGRMVNGVFVAAPPGVFVDANFKLQASAK